jgi:hypothetical protein
MRAGWTTIKVVGGQCGSQLGFHNCFFEESKSCLVQLDARARLSHNIQLAHAHQTRTCRVGLVHYPSCLVAEAPLCPLAARQEAPAPQWHAGRSGDAADGGGFSHGHHQVQRHHCPAQCDCPSMIWMLKVSWQQPLTRRLPAVRLATSGTLISNSGAMLMNLDANSSYTKQQTSACCVGSDDNHDDADWKHHPTQPCPAWYHRWGHRDSHEPTGFLCRNWCNIRAGTVEIFDALFVDWLVRMHPCPCR